MEQPEPLLSDIEEEDESEWTFTTEEDSSAAPSITPVIAVAECPTMIDDALSPQRRCAAPMLAPDIIVQRRRRRQRALPPPSPLPSQSSTAVVEEGWDNGELPPLQGWNDANEDTIKDLQNNISKSSFVYSELMDHNEGRVQMTLVVTLIVGALMTLLAAVSVAVSVFGGVETTTQQSPTSWVEWTTFAFNILMLFGAGVVTVFNGLVKIYSWDEKFKELTRFVEKLDSQWHVFDTELKMPPEYRQNAKDFIIRANADYSHLMQQCPHISVQEYVSANQSYQEQLSENFVWQQKFNHRLENQLSEINRA
jgi:hypothetical protein